MQKTLRIKKKFYDQIRLGLKTKEYRSVKDYYSFLSDPELRWLKLHYQQPGKYLFCRVDKVRVIQRPDFLADSPIDFTPMVYEIRLEMIDEVGK